MQTSSTLRRESSSASVIAVTRAQGDALAEAARHEAANDAAAAPTEYRPNPLWAVNGAMAAFFIIAAVLIANG